MASLSSEVIIGKLNEKFGDLVLSSEMLYDVLTFTVKADRIIDVLRFCYDDEVLRFQFLTTLCGMHYPDAPKEKQFGVVYHLHNLRDNIRIRIKIFLPADHPEVNTATTLFSTANWMERETYDFYGINFKGHPDLRRILNVEDMVAFPLRKDFPLEDQTREDKNDSMFGR